MIRGNYLQVHKWRHNFLTNLAKITSLPVWIRFPWLPMEYYPEEWLRKAGGTIGKTIKMNMTTLATSRGKFAWVCVEIDLDKLLVARYWKRKRDSQLQYEGLHDLCLTCGKYGHNEIKCPLATTNQAAELRMKVAGWLTRRSLTKVGH